VFSVGILTGLMCSPSYCQCPTRATSGQGEQVKPHAECPQRDPGSPHMCLAPDLGPAHFSRELCFDSTGHSQFPCQRCPWLLVSRPIQ
jgi:hypothetical protein